MGTKIAMLQLRVDFKQEEENFCRAEKEIAKAAGLGCRCAVLPECFDIGWGTPEETVSKALKTLPKSGIIVATKQAGVARKWAT